MNNMLSEFQEYIRVVPIKAYAFQPSLDLKILDASFKMPTEGNAQYLPHKPNTSIRALTVEKSDKKLHLQSDTSSLSQFRIEGNMQPTTAYGENVYLGSQWRPSTAKNTSKTPYIAMAMMRRKKEKAHIAELLKKTDGYFIKVDESLVNQTNSSDPNSSFYRTGLKGSKVRRKRIKSRKAHSFYLEKPSHNRSYTESFEQNTSFGVFQDPSEGKSPTRPTNNNAYGHEAVRKLMHTDPANLSPSPVMTDYSGKIATEKTHSRKLASASESEKTRKFQMQQQHHGIPTTNESKSKEVYKLRDILSHAKDQATLTDGPHTGNAVTSDSPILDLSATPVALEQSRIGFSPELLKVTRTEMSREFTPVEQHNKRPASTDPNYSGSPSKADAGLGTHQEGELPKRSKTANSGRRHPTIGTGEEHNEKRHSRLHVASRKDPRLTHYTFDFGRFIKIMNPERCTLGSKVKIHSLVIKKI